MCSQSLTPLNDLLMTSPDRRLAADNSSFCGESVTIRLAFASDSPAADATIATDSPAVRQPTTPDRNLSRAPYCICHIYTTWRQRGVLAGIEVTDSAKFVCIWPSIQTAPTVRGWLCCGRMWKKRYVKYAINVRCCYYFHNFLQLLYIVSLGYNCSIMNFLTNSVFYMVGFSFSFRIELWLSFIIILSIFKVIN